MTPGKPTAPPSDERRNQPSDRPGGPKGRPEEDKIYGGDPQIRQTGAKVKDTQHPPGTRLAPDKAPGARTDAPDSADDAGPRDRGPS